MFAIIEWFPGALEETYCYAEDSAHAWDLAFAAARNFAEHTDGKVDTIKFDNATDGILYRATVKIGTGAAATYTVVEA